MKKINFRGSYIKIFKDRIVNKKDNLFYYEIRHAEDWNIPETIEEKVDVNFWGSIESSMPLDFSDYIELSGKEKDDFYKYINNLEEVDEK